jgi:hypothetical protein
LVALDEVIDGAEERAGLSLLPSIVRQSGDIEFPNVLDVQMGHGRSAGSRMHVCLSDGPKEPVMEEPRINAIWVRTDENCALSKTDAKALRYPDDVADGRLPCENEVAFHWFETAGPQPVGLAVDGLA